MINKETFKAIIDKYSEAEEIISQLDNDYGINLWDSSNENFYNKYNYCIFELLQSIFGEDGRMLIEDYLFGGLDATFDDICISLEINE